MCLIVGGWASLVPRRQVFRPHKIWTDVQMGRHLGIPSNFVSSLRDTKHHTFQT